MTTVKQRLAMVPVADLWYGDNIRSDPGDISSLVDSIREVGVLEPIVVWPSQDGGRPEVGMGQRRLAAARRAGLNVVPCILRGRPQTRDRILMQLAENHERADMSPVDEGRAFRDLIDMGVPRLRIAQSLRKSETWVYHRTKLLDMPQAVQDAAHAGSLTPSAALEFPLALLEDDAAMARLNGLHHINDTTFRRWIKDEYQAREKTTAKIERRGTRVCPVEINAYELARDRSRLAGQTLSEWVTAAIYGHAENEVDTRPEVAI